MEPSGPDGGSAPDLTPDVATTQVSADMPSGAVPLVGLLGEDPSPEFLRLYETVALNRWIGIPIAAIVDRVSADGGGDVTAGQSVIWVDRDADLVSCTSVRASSFEVPADSDPDIPRKWPRP